MQMASTHAGLMLLILLTQMRISGMAGEPIHGSMTSVPQTLTPVWVQRHANDVGTSPVVSVAQTIDNSGNVYALFSSIATYTGEDYLIVKCSAAGEKQWTIRYDGPAHCS
ncbi:MAG: hypothetical protein WB699_08095, partial [Bacteroidota bacterium]